MNKTEKQNDSMQKIHILCILSLRGHGPRRAIPKWPNQRERKNFNKCKQTKSKARFFVASSGSKPKSSAAIRNTSLMGARGFKNCLNFKYVHSPLKKKLVNLRTIRHS